MATKKKTAVKSATARAGHSAKKAAPAKPARSAAGKAVAPKKAAKPAAKAPAKAASKTAKKPVVSKKPVAKPARPATVKAAKPSAKKVTAKPVVKASSKKTVPEKKPPVKKTVVKEIPVIEKKVAKKEEKKVVKAPKKVVVPKLSTRSSVKYQPDFTKSVLDTPAIEKAPSVIRYSDSDLAEFKEIILRKLDAAKKELAYLQGLITRRDEGGDMDEGRYMTMEDGSVSMEREQLSQLASRQITFIDHLEKALMRVENKTYGICRVTGHLIDKARLRAVPHATLSMEAKSMMNR
ncbi:TraR/DksA family transcriptional regulator [Niabella soli]|uniref:TraR/DksA family transcriptional regulator n=1 Tax=Niabella soli TaxID=446683 RepID=UPI0002499342|nr:TraR/DksA C4-type zinc finger protein [Niabella soli]